MPFPFSSRIRIIQMFFKVFGAETFQDLGREFGPGDERDLTTFDPGEAFAVGWAKAAPAFHWGTAHVPLCPRLSHVAVSHNRTGGQRGQRRA
jgi:hypothetical protein